MIPARRRASDPVPRNAATREADYRRDTANIPAYVVPKMRHCATCNRMRTDRQFIPSSSRCETCRGKHGA